MRNENLSCEVPWMRRRRELEDMPTRRISAQTSDDADCAALAQLTMLSQQQTQLLCELLGAVNGLTAAQLAALGR